MIFIDIYVRNYWRREAVKVLVDAGIQVDVFGKGWDELHLRSPGKHDPASADNLRGVFKSNCGVQNIIKRHAMV